MTHKNSNKQTTLTLVLFIVYLLALVWLILLKLYPVIHGLTPGVRALNLLPFSSSGGWSEVRDNFLAFIPFGLFMGMLGLEWPFWKKALPILGVSLAFEVIQFAAAIGRSDITDFISNGLGGLLGLGAYLLLHRLFARYKERQYGLLAQGVRGALDMKLIYRILEKGV
jgi:glycopeptide antibiotics resistance protein